MDDMMIYILLLCITPPLLLSLTVVDKKARLYVFFILIGFYTCFVVSGVNSFFLELLDNDIQYVTTVATPITEEIMKAIPILLYAFLFNHNRQKLMGLGFLVGVGLAMMENLIILLSTYQSVDLFWALIRGFSSSCLHGVCTALVAFGLSFVSQKKKLFVPGTFALLIVAITTHGTFNTLVQSEYEWMGYIMPLLIYSGLSIRRFINRKMIGTLKAFSEGK